MLFWPQFYLVGFDLWVNDSAELVYATGPRSYLVQVNVTDEFGNSVIYGFQLFVSAQATLYPCLPRRRTRVEKPVKHNPHR